MKVHFRTNIGLGNYRCLTYNTLTPVLVHTMQYGVLSHVALVHQMRSYTSIITIRI